MTRPFFLCENPLPFPTSAWLFSKTTHHVYIVLGMVEYTIVFVKVYNGLGAYKYFRIYIWHMNMSMYTGSCFCICYCLFVCLVWDWYPPKTDPQSLGVPFCEKLQKIKSRGSRPRQQQISKIWANPSGNIPPRRGHVDHVVFVWGEGRYMAFWPVWVPQYTRSLFLVNSEPDGPPRWKKQKDCWDPQF